MAGAILGSIPVSLIYSFFLKYYVASITTGDVMGSGARKSEVRFLGALASKNFRHLTKT